MRSLSGAMQTEIVKKSQTPVFLLEWYHYGHGFYWDEAFTQYLSDRDITWSGHDYKAMVVDWGTLFTALDQQSHSSITSNIQIRLSNAEIDGRRLSDQMHTYYAEGYTDTVTLKIYYPGTSASATIFKGIIYEIEYDKKDFIMRITSSFLPKIFEYNRKYDNKIRQYEFSDIYYGRIYQGCIGKIKPLVFGEVDNYDMLCLKWRHETHTTQEEAIGTNKIHIPPDEIDYFPLSGTIKVDDEELDYGSKNAGGWFNLSGVTAVIHYANAPVIDITHDATDYEDNANIFLVANNACKSVTEIRAGTTSIAGANYTIWLNTDVFTGTPTKGCIVGIGKLPLVATPENINCLVQGHTNDGLPTGTLLQYPSEIAKEILTNTWYMSVEEGYIDSTSFNDALTKHATLTWKMAFVIQTETDWMTLLAKIAKQSFSFLYWDSVTKLKFIFIDLDWTNPIFTFDEEHSLAKDFKIEEAFKEEELSNHYRIYYKICIGSNTTTKLKGEYENNSSLEDADSKSNYTGYGTKDDVKIYADLIRNYTYAVRYLGIFNVRFTAYSQRKHTYHTTLAGLALEPGDKVRFYSWLYPIYRNGYVLSAELFLGGINELPTVKIELLEEPLCAMTQRDYYRIV